MKNCIAQIKLNRENKQQSMHYNTRECELHRLIDNIPHDPLGYVEDHLIIQIYSVQKCN